MQCPECLTECSNSALFCSSCGFKFSDTYKQLLEQLERLKSENKDLRDVLLSCGAIEYTELQRKKEALEKEIEAQQAMSDGLQLEIHELLTIRSDLLNGIDFEHQKWRKKKQREGIDIAIAEGRYKGRPKVEYDEEKFETLYPEWKAGKITARKFMQELGLKPNTFYRTVQNYELNFRTSLARTEKAAAGGYSGGRPPYGYKPSRGTLVIDEAEALVVRDMFAMRETGMTLEQIAKIVNERGTLTRKGNPWTFGTIRTILDNEKLYRGMYKYGDGDWVRGTHEPIL